AVGRGSDARVRLLDVGGIVASIADEDRVLTLVREHHELLRSTSADRSGIRVDRAELEPAALEDAVIGTAHRVVALVQPGGVGVEGVRVLHDELTPAHQSEAGTDLVPELVLDLIEVEGELLVRVANLLHVGRDDLFVSRSETELGILAVGEMKEDAVCDVT